MTNMLGVKTIVTLWRIFWKNQETKWLPKAWHGVSQDRSCCLRSVSIWVNSLYHSAKGKNPLRPDSFHLPSVALFVWSFLRLIICQKYATLFVSIFCRFSVSFFLARTPACLLAPWLAHSFVSFLLRFLLSKPWRCWEKEENNITFSPQKKGVIGDKIHINLFIAMSPPLQSPRTREAIFLFHFGTASSHAARRPWLVFALASFGVSWPTGRPNTFTVGRLSLKNKTLETCQTWKENIKHFQYSQIQQNLPRHSKVNHHLLTGNILFSNLAYNKLSMYS